MSEYSEYFIRIQEKNINLDHFIYSIQHLLSQEENNVYIILGDFNANYFNYFMITMVENSQIYLQITSK